jgi:ribosomal protein S27AE
MLDELTPEEKAAKDKVMDILAESVLSGKIKTAKHLDPDAIITCVALEDDDYREINKYWDIEDNKSFPRDLFCSECNRQVMLSNWMFREYEANKLAGHTNKIICGKCLNEKIKKH